MEFEKLLAHFKGVTGSGRERMALCPAHNDHTPSLSIGLSEDGEKILINCFAGCKDEEILSAAGLKPSDLFVRSAACRHGGGKESLYVYLDTDGSPLYFKIRTDNADGTKSFCFYQANGKMGVKGVKRVPYNLLSVCAASKVYFVEGEKCAEAIIEQGYVATTLDSGSNSKWTPHLAQYFEGKQVIILPDNDEPGKKYALQAARNIPNAIIKVLPGLAEKEDVFDWLAAGHTMDEVDSLPEYKSSDEAESSDAPSKKDSQAEIMLKLCDKSALKLFMDENNELYATLPVNGHKEVIAVDSKDFSLLLRELFYQEMKYPIRQEILTQVINTLEARGRFENKERHRLYNRVAKADNSFWYDLCDPDCQAVRTSADGWEIRKDIPILFRRYRHQQEQAPPQAEGDIRKILDYVNIKRFQTLFLCWLVTCFVPEIPHPMPIIYGEKGAAKSTACVLLKRLIDPSASDTLSLSKDSRTLVVNFQHHYFLPFDNVSAITDETSDMLCRAITGGSVQQRRLCTNAEDYIFSFMRCIAINGINNVANRTDLLDRSLIFELERVSDTKRRELAAVYEDFERDRPFILGGIFQTLSKAISIFPGVNLDKLPRMADFSRWGYAVAEALGLSGEQFVKDYTENIALQNLSAIESDCVAALVIEFMGRQQEWSGRMSQLHKELLNIAEQNGINQRGKCLPTHPNGLSRRLSQLKSNLASVGISFSKQSKSDGAYITLINEKTSPFPSYHVDIPEDVRQHHGGDGDDDFRRSQLSPSGKAPDHAENEDNGGDEDDFDGAPDF